MCDDQAETAAATGDEIDPPVLPGLRSLFRPDGKLAKAQDLAHIAHITDLTIHSRLHARVLA